MLFLLIVLMFNADGDKNAQVKIEPTVQACQQEADKVIADIHADRPEELIGLGVKCDGPFNDPTVPKIKA